MFRFNSPYSQPSYGYPFNREQYARAIAEERARREYERALAEERARQQYLEEEQYRQQLARERARQEYLAEQRARREYISQRDALLRQRRAEALRRYGLEEEADEVDPTEHYFEAPPVRRPSPARKASPERARSLSPHSIPVADRERRPSPARKECPQRARSSSPHSIPVAEPAKPQIDPEVASKAASTIQSHWRNSRVRAKAFAAVAAIASSFDSLRTSFAFPSELNFSDSGKLLYTHNNAPVHAYEHALTSLLAKIDEIDSHGLKEVRERRKALVARVENELEALDKKKEEAWKAISTISTSSDIEVDAPTNDLLTAEPSADSTTEPTIDTVVESAVEPAVELEAEPTVEDVASDSAATPEVEMSDTAGAAEDEASPMPVDVEQASTSPSPAEPVDIDVGPATPSTLPDLVVDTEVPTPPDVEMEALPQKLHEHDPSPAVAEPVEVSVPDVAIATEVPLPESSPEEDIREKPIPALLNSLSDVTNIPLPPAEKPQPLTISHDLSKPGHPIDATDDSEELVVVEDMLPDAIGVAEEASDSESGSDAGERTVSEVGVEEFEVV